MTLFIKFKRDSCEHCLHKCSQVQCGSIFEDPRLGRKTDFFNLSGTDGCFKQVSPLFLRHCVGTSSCSEKGCLKLAASSVFGISKMYIYVFLVSWLQNILLVWNFSWLILIQFLFKLILLKEIVFIQSLFFKMQFSDILVWDRRNPSYLIITQVSQFLLLLKCILILNWQLFWTCVEYWLNFGKP